MKSLTLVCAATPIEAKACRKGIQAAGREEQFEVLQTGMGVVNARTALEARLADSKRQKPGLVISTGFAGSRHRELSVGSWIIGRSVCFEKDENSPLVPSEVSFSETDRLSFRLELARVITVLHAETVPPEGFQLAPGELPVAIDMESHAWGDVSKSHEIPFRVIRLISDNPDFRFPASLGMLIAAFDSNARRQFLPNFAKGISQASREPLHLARFSLQTAKLLKVLESGWQGIALL